MKFLANENYPLASVRKIAAAGHEIESVTLMMQGQPDITILHKAAEEQSVILTFDRDYGMLIYQFNLPKPAGILFYRMQPLHPDEPADLLLELLSEGRPLIGWFTTYARGRLRQRVI
jgi:predicted nuclease of predicted toxin-antitoxin system